MNKPIRCRDTKARVLLNLEADQLTTEAILSRLQGIRGELRRLSGVLDGLSERRVKTNTRYWLSTLKGWSDRLKTNSNELLLAHTFFVRKLSE